MVGQRRELRSVAQCVKQIPTQRHLFAAVAGPSFPILVIALPGRKYSIIKQGKQEFKMLLSCFGIVKIFSRLQRRNYSSISQPSTNGPSGDEYQPFQVSGR
jgi:hypothetical protein